MSRSRIAGLLASTLLCALVIAAPAYAAFPGANGKIAFDSGGHINLIDPDGSGRTMLPRLGQEATWSPDGTHIAFIAPGPSDPQCGGYSGIFCNDGDLYVMNANGTGRTNLTSTMYAIEGLEGRPSWTPDGQWITFTRYQNNATPYRAFSIRPDGTGENEIPLPPGAIKSVAWSPDGKQLAYARQAGSLPYLYLANADGSGERKLCCADPIEWAKAPDWAPDGHALVFSHGNAPGTIMRVNRDGSGLTILSDCCNGSNAEQPAWSPDGTKIVFSSYRSGISWRLYTMNPDGSDVRQIQDNAYDPNWQPIPINYARPKGATPMYASLVPAYKQCTAPDNQHGAPLNYPSCSIPQGTSESSQLTVGTADANGSAANMVGSVRLRAIPGDPKTAADEANVLIDLSVTDVRCVASNPSPFCTSDNSGPIDLKDYGGELQAKLALRITDKNNVPSPGGSGPGTVEDFSFAFAIPCQGTTGTGASSAIGSTCALSTSADAITPGAVQEGVRSIWQVGRIEVYDGGTDGLASTTADNTLFLDQGVFVL
jgi:WD40 repeat protein